MPPKRRKGSDPLETAEPKRPATRSSTRIKASLKQEDVDTIPDECNPRQKIPKASKPKSTSTKPTSRTETTTAKKEVGSSGLNPSPGPAILTITHETVKKPIICHHYTPTCTPEKNTSTLIFTHGAGGTLFTPAVLNFCTGYSQTFPILAFQGSMNLPSRVKGFHACLSHLDSTTPNNLPAQEKKIILSGRSMGSRAAVLAALDILHSSPSANISLVLISYPLQGPKDFRDQILIDLPAGIDTLFVVGEKDSMCPLDLLHDTRKRMKASSKVVIVKGADHGMHVRPVDRESVVSEETGRLAARWVNGNWHGDGDEVMVIGGE